MAVSYLRPSQPCKNLNSLRRRSGRSVTVQRRELLLAHFFVLRRLLDLLDVFQPADAFANRRQIGQRSAEPALVDVKLTARQCRFLDRFLRLLLAADKQNFATAARHLLKKCGRAVKLLHRFIEIDDVNLVPPLEDERLHLRVPALGLVTEMHARF